MHCLMLCFAPRWRLIDPLPLVQHAVAHVVNAHLFIFCICLYKCQFLGDQKWDFEGPNPKAETTFTASSPHSGGELILSHIPTEKYVFQLGEIEIAKQDHLWMDNSTVN